MELSIGDAATTPATISNVFTANFAGTPTQVFSGTVAWPTRTRGFTLPGPFDSDLTFTTPWPYSGTSGICWEVYISADSGFTNGTSTDFFLAGYARSSGFPTHWGGAVGQGCWAPGKNPLVHRPLTAHGYIQSSTTTYIDYLTFGPASVPVVLKLGLPDDKWNGQNLPFPLSFVGAPAGCNLNINPLLDVFTGMTDSSGRAELSTPFPFTASTTGLNFRTQWFAFNSARNQITSVSNGLNHLVPFDGVNRIWPVGRNWGTTFGTTKPQSSTGRPPNGTAASGGISTDYGMITEWRHL
jgi:hypothetical protein